MFEAELAQDQVDDTQDQVEETTPESVQDTEAGTETETTSDDDAPFAAWDLPKPKPELPTHIPYDRFRSVAEERTVLFEDNRALAARIKELEGLQERAAAVKDPADIKIDDYDNLDDYLRARDNAVAARISADFEGRMAAKEQQRLEQVQNQTLHDQAVARFNEQVAENPNIAKASAFFNDHLDNIPAPVARELALDPNTGFVQLRLCTDKALLRQFFESTPAQALRLINRISARIDAERESAPARRAPEAGEAPRAAARVAAAKPLPVSLKQTQSRSNLDLYKDADAMSIAQWRKLRSGKR